MIFTTKSRFKSTGVPQSFTRLGKSIHYVSQYNYLGLLIDSEMSLTPLLKNIKKLVSNIMFALRKFCKYLTCDTAVLVNKQTILPFFDCAELLLISLKNNDKSDLQTRQNDALHFCMDIQLLYKVAIAKMHDSV